MTDTMRALLGGAGPDWEVREVDIPTPGPGMLLVRVRAAALNRADLHMLEGVYNPGRRPATCSPPASSSPVRSRPSATA